jgi:2-oxoglutarate ferredoxin oxidoreductase subunit alpha
VSPLGSGEHGAHSSYADHLVECTRATEAMLAGIEPLAETGFCDDADVVVVAFGTPAKYVRAAVTRLRAEGARIGYVRPITLLPFPSEILANAARGARTVAVYENSQGQMIDDVRLALEGAVPVQFIGRLSLDSSGFGIAPDLDSDYLRNKLLEVLDG